MNMAAAVPPRLCSLADLPDGQSRGFDPFGAGHDTMFVVRQGEQLHAYLDSCPHWTGTPLPWRRHAYLSGDGSQIVCSAHGARFDIATGACVLGPCLGQSLTPVPLHLSASGDLQLYSTTPQDTTPWP